MPEDAALGDRQIPLVVVAAVAVILVAVVAAVLAACLVGKLVHYLLLISRL